MSFFVVATLKVKFWQQILEDEISFGCGEPLAFWFVYFLFIVVTNPLFRACF